MKRVGIIVSKNGEGGLGIPSAYAQYFAQFGLLIPINAMDDVLHTNIDLLVLQGGADVQPERYGKRPSYFTQNPNIQMEWWDANMMPQYVENRTPIFAVCRGFQSLNVYFNGSLNQNIYQEYSAKREDLAHPVVYTDQAIAWNRNRNWFDTRNGKNGEGAFKVNSMHHQGFNINQCGNGVIPILKHSFRPNVEAFIVDGFPIAGVQWHPEEIWDAYSNKIINYLADGNSF